MNKKIALFHIIMFSVIACIHVVFLKRKEGQENE